MRDLKCAQQKPALKHKEYSSMSLSIGCHAAAVSHPPQDQICGASLKACNKRKFSALNIYLTKFSFLCGEWFIVMRVLSKLLKILLFQYSFKLN